MLLAYLSRYFKRDPFERVRAFEIRRMRNQFSQQRIDMGFAGVSMAFLQKCNRCATSTSTESTDSGRSAKLKSGPKLDPKHKDI